MREVDEKEYKPESVAECLEMISDVGFGYDGYNDVDGLKSLIDEMRHYAHVGLNIMDNMNMLNKYTKERLFGKE